MKYCAIVPDRGDRPQFFEFCVKQINRMGMGNACYLMNEKPKSDEVDIVPRIRQGIEMAKHDGFEFIYCIESDDWYPADYITGDVSNLDFIGFSSTLYYNLRNRTYEIMKHKGRSSLFCTGFRISALEGFNWPADNAKFLDIDLWQFANNFKKRIKLIEEPIALGIKHGIGKCGGKGHQLHMKNQDNNLHFLQTFVDEEAFIFYSNLIKERF